METRYFSSIIDIVEKGSIADASKINNITSAAISQRVKALENILGCQLLNRDGHTAKPTSICLKLIPRFKRIISEVEAIAMDVDEKGLSGEIRVGAISSILSGILPNIIKDFSINSKNVSIKIFPGTSADLYNQLVEAKLDLIITVAPFFSVPKYILQLPLYHEKLGFISNKDSIISIRDQLSTKPFIQYDSKSWGGRLVEDYLSNQNIKINKVCEIDSLESIVMMVNQGLGVSLIPIWKGIENFKSNILITPISDKQYHRHISILSHRQLGKEPLIEAFSKTALKNIKAVS